MSPQRRRRRRGIWRRRRGARRQRGGDDGGADAAVHQRVAKRLGLRKAPREAIAKSTARIKAARLQQHDAAQPREARRPRRVERREVAGRVGRIVGEQPRQRHHRREQQAERRRRVDAREQRRDGERDDVEGPAVSAAARLEVAAGQRGDRHPGVRRQADEQHLGAADGRTGCGRWPSLARGGRGAPVCQGAWRTGHDRSAEVVRLRAVRAIVVGGGCAGGVGCARATRAASAAICDAISRRVRERIAAAAPPLLLGAIPWHAQPAHSLMPEDQDPSPPPPPCRRRARRPRPRRPAGAVKGIFNAHDLNGGGHPGRRRSRS